MCVPILQGLQTEVLAVHQEQSASNTGLDHEGWNHLTAPIQTPSSQPNLPLAPQPAQPTTNSTSTPPPLPAQSHTHTQTPLSPAVCQSLSLPPLPQSGQRSSLLSSLHPSTTLSLPPPAVRATGPGSALFVFTPACWKDLGLLLFTNFSWRLHFHSWPFLFFGSLTLPLRRGCSVCVRRVRGGVCEGSGVTLFAPRESLKVVTEGETFSPPWMFSCCSWWPWLALSAPTHMQVSEVSLYHHPARSTLCPLTPSASMCPHRTTLCLLLIPADWTVTLCRLVSERRVSSVLMCVSLN